MSNSWWAKQPETDPAHAEDTEPAPGAPPQSTPRKRTPQPSLSSESLGEQIDEAIGEFDRRLMSLREALENKKAEIADIEHEIDTIEKEQAKAFKDLLSGNPAIKRMLGTGNRRRANRRQKPRRKTDDAPSKD
jgi:flagellar motility protein MotE (MotC chaperone)